MTARTPEEIEARVREAQGDEAEAYDGLLAAVCAESPDRLSIMRLARAYGIACAIHQLAVRDRMDARYDARLNAILAGHGEAMAAVMAPPADGRP